MRRRLQSLSSKRLYTPGSASIADLNALHKAIHIDRVVVVHPSPYGSDNACTVDAVRQIFRADGRKRVGYLLYLDAGQHPRLVGEDGGSGFVATGFECKEKHDWPQKNAKEHKGCDLMIQVFYCVPCVPLRLLFTFRPAFTLAKEGQRIVVHHLLYLRLRMTAPP